MATTRTCLDPRMIRHLERDGLGWGHDLDSGCVRFDVLDGEAKPGRLVRAWRRFARRAV